MIRGGHKGPRRGNRGDHREFFWGKILKDELQCFVWKGVHLIISSRAVVVATAVPEVSSRMQQQQGGSWTGRRCKRAFSKVERRCLLKGRSLAPR